MCKGDLESMDHLLLCCRYATALWELCFQLLRYFWVVSKSLRNHLLVWKGFFGRKLEEEEAIVLSDVIVGVFGERN